MTARSPSTAGSHTTAKARARAAAAEAARVKARRQRQLRVLLVAIIAIVVAVGAFALWFWPAGGSQPATTRAGLSSVSGRGAEHLPPWPAPSDVPARAEAAGLPLGPMGMAEHYHVHLDVLVDGKPIAVPANLGVDPSTGEMSYLHTHTPDGVVHIEAGRSGQPFTLGQLFIEWDVRLSATQIGGLKATGGKELTLYVDGKLVPGDPALLRLRPHQQITLVYGPAGQRVDVPESYPFAPGE
jgi:hypothetical protein